MVKIRLLRKADIREATSIVRKNYSAKYAKLAARELGEMFGPSAIRPMYVAAEEDGKIVGFAGWMISRMDYHVCNIFWVNVSPSAQRRGIGKKLVNNILAAARKREPNIHLALLTTSSPKYYSRHFGFRKLTTFGPKKHHLMAFAFK